MDHFVVAGNVQSGISLAEIAKNGDARTANGPLTIPKRTADPTSSPTKEIAMILRNVMGFSSL